MFTKGESNLKTGDILSITDYVEVVEVGHQRIKVKNLDNGVLFSIKGQELLDDTHSASEVKKTEKTPLTKIAERLTASYNVAFEVKFKKANGEDRVLRGRLLGAEPVLGRSYVEDLDIDKDDPKGRKRLVDHRTLQYLIVDGVKYHV